MHHDDISPGDRTQRSTSLNGPAKAPKSATSPREVLDDKMQDWHDYRHPGNYVECAQCTSVWGFVTDNPQYLR